MKKIFTLLAGLLTAISMFAAGETINYQAILRNADGSLAAGKNVGIRFRILAGTAGEQLYAEEVSATTDANGMVDCAIGANGDVALLDWNRPDLKLEVGIDMNGGSNYSAVYTSDIRSVAKSLYSLRSADSEELRAYIEELSWRLQDIFERSEISDMELKGDIEKLNVIVSDHENAFNDIYTALANISNEINNIVPGGSNVEIKEEIAQVRQDVVFVLNTLNEKMAKLDELDERISKVENQTISMIETVTGVMQTKLDEVNLRLEDKTTSLEIEVANNRDYIDQLLSLINVLENEVADLKAKVEVLENK